MPAHLGLAGVVGVVEGDAEVPGGRGVVADLGGALRVDGGAAGNFYG